MKFNFFNCYGISKVNNTKITAGACSLDCYRRVYTGQTLGLHFVISLRSPKLNVRLQKLIDCFLSSEALVSCMRLC